MTELSVLIDWKSESYNSILVIIDRLTKMVYYKPMKIKIDTSSLAEVIINVIIWYYGLFNSIITD